VPPDEKAYADGVDLSLPATQAGGHLLSLGADNIAFIPPQKGVRRHVEAILCNWHRGIISLLEREGARGAGFLFLPVFVGGGVITYFQLEREPAWDRLVVSCLLLALLARLLRHVRFLMLLCGFLTASCFGALLAKMETSRLATRFIPWEMTGEITVRLLEWQGQEAGGYRLIVQIVAIETDDLILQRGQKLRLVSQTLPEGMEIGEGLRGLVRLRPPSGPVRTGGYDFSFHAFYRSLSGQGFFMGAPQRVALPAPSNYIERMQLAVAAMRSVINQRIITAIEGEAGAIAAALITGQRAGISRRTNEVLRLSGLAHILSISGLHMAMVTGLVLLLCRFILGFFPVFPHIIQQGKLLLRWRLSLRAFIVCSRAVRWRRNVPLSWWQ